MMPRRGGPTNARQRNDDPNLMWLSVRQLCRLIPFRPDKRYAVFHAGFAERSRQNLNLDRFRQGSQQQYLACGVAHRDGEFLAVAG